MKEVITETTHLTFDGKILTSKLIKNIELEVHHVDIDFEASQKITEGKKYLSLVLPLPDTSITPEAQKKSMKKDRYKNAVAQAIIIHSLAQRLIGVFIIKFIKHPVPCQLFSTEEKAVKWLNKEWTKAGLN